SVRMAQKSYARRKVVKVLLNMYARRLLHGIATEPGSGNRQLQEKAGGIDPDGLFSFHDDHVSITVVARTQRITSTRTALQKQALVCRCACSASAPASADAPPAHRRRRLPAVQALAAVG